MERREDAHRLHRDDHTGAVIGCSGACDPTVQMASDHDHLVFQLRIDTRNFSNGVVTLLVIARELRVDSY